MTLGVDKARQRFHLEHARLGVPQTKLQAFLERVLDSKGRIRSYGTTTNVSQQLKNKLSQAIPIAGGLLTLSVESRSVHDRAVTTLVEDWASNVGWPKSVACVALIHPADAGWKLATIVEWTRSRFPDLVRERLFPDVAVVQAKGSPAAVVGHGGRDDADARERHGARVLKVGSSVLVRQTRYDERDPQNATEDGRERAVDLTDDASVAKAVRDALRGRL